MTDCFVTVSLVKGEGGKEKKVKLAGSLPVSEIYVKYLSKSPTMHIECGSEVIFPDDMRPLSFFIPNLNNENTNTAGSENTNASSEASANNNAANTNRCISFTIKAGIECRITLPD